MSLTVETWEILESKEIADCRVFTVHEQLRQSGKKKANFFVIENRDWVNVVAVTRTFDVVLIEQFRHGTNEITLEIPGGIVDDGEEPEAAARRELLEETGYTAEKFILIGRSRPNPAIQTNWVYHYAAIDAVKTAEVSFDEHESVSASLCAVTSVPTLIQSGDITHSLVLAAFQFFSFYLMKI